jgi:hypothetical protein
MTWIIKESMGGPVKSRHYPWKNSSVCTSGPCHHYLIQSMSLSTFFFFFGGTGVWTQGFTFAKQGFYHLSHTSSPFCSGNRVWRTICLNCPRTKILLISASQVLSEWINGSDAWATGARLIMLFLSEDEQASLEEDKISMEMLACE